MRLLNALWTDELGAVVSAEVVTVASIAVVSTVAGLNALSTSINGEMLDVAKSIRSLDQSYSYRGFQTPHAWYAGSSFTQRPVNESLAELDMIAAQPGDDGAVDKPEPAQPKDAPKTKKTKRPFDRDDEALNSPETPASEKI